jgi:hypothetical protein
MLHVTDRETCRCQLYHGYGHYTCSLPVGHEGQHQAYDPPVTVSWTSAKPVAFAHEEAPCYT